MLEVEPTGQRVHWKWSKRQRIGRQRRFKPILTWYLTWCLVMDIAVGCYAYGNMFWCM